MSKIKTSYQCQNCNYKAIRWLGCCPECKEWETFKEITYTASNASNQKKRITSEPNLVSLNSISIETKQRMLSGISEWDRVVGGGIMPSSLIILTGDPGIGKSTLLLQISNNLAQNYTVFYFSSEESLNQVKNRAERLGCINDNLLFSDKADLESIIEISKNQKPDLLIIDSIQNCYSSETDTTPGSISQLRETAFLLMRLAKENDIAIIISGHITKDGNIAGPKTLEHMVDAVFYLQGEDRWQTRVLRSEKNRFGTINELGFFQMEQKGLQEMPNINQHLIEQASHAPGSALVSFIEGSRPLLLELQALTISSKLTMPQRIISGIDHKQVALIAAILEKYLKIKLSSCDIFFKVGGGFKIKGSSCDLGIALSLLSSYFQQNLPEKSIALGEISLTGQIKPVNQVNMHIKEATKFGIEQIFMAHDQKLEKNSCKKITKFSSVYELLTLFG
ncbi:MAG: repair protein radA protein [candidate division TM6 bacterium GW2011_GWF2_30_66]|jgi:DNA repair protein RadA/Sms|nr:MAG: repair protein radA protein [candidate division TM6 bacterium GW2011_GWF2_30_66]